MGSLRIYCGEPRYTLWRTYVYATHTCAPTILTHNIYVCIYCGYVLWVHTYVLWVHTYILWVTWSTVLPTIYTCCPQYIQVLYILWVHYLCHPQYIPTIHTNTHDVYPQYIQLYILWVYIVGASRIYCGCNKFVCVVGAVEVYR